MRRNRLMRNILMGGGTPWYLYGGIPRANCIAAWQSIGVSSFAHSLINLPNPGTYNAIDPGGVLTPTWSSKFGWATDQLDGSYLTSTVTPATAQTWSMLVRFRNAALNAWICGSYNATGGSRIYSVERQANTRISNGGGKWCPAAPLGGVLGFAGPTAYENGIAEVGAIAAGDAIVALPINPIGLNYDGGSNFGYSNNILAEAWWDIILTPVQMAAVSAAMLALGSPSFPVLSVFGDSVVTGTGASDRAHRFANIIATTKEWMLYNKGRDATILQNTIQNTVATIGAAADNNGRDTYAG